MPYYNPRFFPEYDYNQRTWSFLRRDRNLVDVSSRAAARQNLGVPIESTIDETILGIDGSSWISPRRLRLMLDRMNLSLERPYPPRLLFPMRAGVTVNTTQTSDPRSIPTDALAWPARVVNGEWRRNGGSWTNQPGTVLALDSIEVRHTSSATANGLVTTEFILGNGDHQTISFFRSLTGTVSVTTPTWIAPNANATGVGETPTLTGSTFAVSAGSDIHDSTLWQIWTGANGTGTMVWNFNTTTGLTTTTVTAGSLATSTTYHARHRHSGLTYGTSAWSADRRFTTAASFALNKTLTVTRTATTGRQFEFFTQTGDSVASISTADYPERYNNFLPSNTVVSPNGTYALVVAQSCRLLKKSGAGVWAAVGDDVDVSTFCEGSPSQAVWSPDSTDIIVFGAERHATKNGIAVIKRTGDTIAITSNPFRYSPDPQDNMRVDAVRFSRSGDYVCVGYSGLVNPPIPAFVPGFSTGGGQTAVTIPAQGYWHQPTKVVDTSHWVSPAGEQFSFFGDVSIPLDYGLRSSFQTLNDGIPVWVETSPAQVVYTAGTPVFQPGYQPPYSLVQVAFQAYKVYKKSGASYTFLADLPVNQISNSITRRLRTQNGDVGLGLTGFVEVFPHVAWSPDDEHLAVAIRGASGNLKHGAAAIFKRSGDSFTYTTMVGNTIVGDVNNETYAGPIHYLGYSNNNRLFVLQSRSNNLSFTTLKVHQRLADSYTNLAIPTDNIQDRAHQIAIASRDGAHVYTCRGDQDRRVIRPFAVGVNTATALTDITLGSSFTQFSIHEAAT
ncbi:MAG: hypothetical protein DDT26_00819 [Dehalococcoidia bacterium]|nr:hypothetical protein [Chloroflexota bacterium]